jgi:hypothetical protein
VRPGRFDERLPRVVEGEVIETPDSPAQRPIEGSTPDSPADTGPGASSGPAARPAAGRSDTGPGHGPRVAILSLREVRPIADFGGLQEAEDVLRDALAAGLYRVVLASPRYTRAPFDRPAVRRALGSTRLARPYRIEHHQRHGEPADVLLVLARDLRDASVLVGVPEWYRLGRTVLVHLSVVTEVELRRYPELVSQLRRRVDALFSGSEMPPLGHLRSERLHTVGVVPPLLDVLAFRPRPHAERTVDVFSPGPKPPGQHQLLTEWAARHGGKYQHDIGQLGAITSLAQHRRIFTTMATRARVFLTNYEQFGHRRHAGAHREVGPRFYEAMAAGCVLTGDLPTSSRQFAEYVADAAPLRFPADAAALPTEVAAALGDPARSERLGRTARVAALRRNDVAHRWRAMAELAGIPASPGIQARIAQLAELANRVAAGGPDASGPDIGGGYRARPGEDDPTGFPPPGASAGGGHRDAAFDRP